MVVVGILKLDIFLCNFSVEKIFSVSFELVREVGHGWPSLEKPTVAPPPPPKKSSTTPDRANVWNAGFADKFHRRLLLYFDDAVLHFERNNCDSQFQP